MPTENQDTKDSLDQLLGKKLLAFEDTPPPAAWTGIQQQLGHSSRADASASLWKNIYFITAAIIIFVGLGIYLFIGKEQASHTETTGQTPAKIRNSDQPESTVKTMQPEKIEGSIQQHKNKTGQLPAASAPVTNKALIGDQKSETKEEKATEDKSPDQVSNSEAAPVHLQHKELTPAIKDSAVASIVPDTLKKVHKPKSFYEKQRKDTSLKYQQLFKKN